MKNSKKLLVIDNYDSFTYNLVQMFMDRGLEICVYRSDKIFVEDVLKFSPDYVLIGPGPKDPQHAGVSIEIIKKMGTRVPILGICLGMQCISEVFGGRTVRSPVPVHGKTSIIMHEKRKIFKGVPNGFRAARYHSLMVADFDEKDIIVTAKTDDSVVMGISHRKLEIHGVQFHPESFMTEHGCMIIENFLNCV